MNLVSAGLSDRGRVRPRNEDALLLRPERGLFAVADGMGGHVGGDIASRVAVDVLDELGPDGLDAEQLRSIFLAAHGAILRAVSADPTLSGMGTTMTALRVRPENDGCLIIHTGDSRAYRFRDPQLHQLTRDHTWVQDQVDAGLLQPEQARAHPYSSVLTSALGIVNGEPEIQVVDVPCDAGDTILLCTDGLTAGLADQDIARLLSREPDMDAAARAFIAAANDAGGSDNITVALVRLLASGQ